MPGYNLPPKIKALVSKSKLSTLLPTQVVNNSFVSRTSQKTLEMLYVKIVFTHIDSSINLKPLLTVLNKGPLADYLITCSQGYIFSNLFL